MKSLGEVPGAQGLSTTSASHLVLQRSGSRNVLRMLGAAEARWDSYGADAFGTAAALDASGNLVYAALEDKPTVAVFSVHDAVPGRAGGASNALSLDFATPVFRLVALPASGRGDHGDFVGAVSVSGEVAFLRSEGGSKTAVYKHVVNVSFDRVLIVTTYGPDHLVVAGLRNGRVVVSIIQIRGAKGEPGAADPTPYPHLYFPSPPKSVLDAAEKSSDDPLLLGFVLEPHAAFLLYRGGVVHVLRPRSYLPAEHGHGLKAWFHTRVTSKKLTKVRRDCYAIPQQAIRLAPLQIMGSGSPPPTSVETCGGVTSLGAGYVAIAYGRLVSVWDGMYGVGHGYVQMNENIEHLAAGDAPGTALAASSKRLYHVEPRLASGDQREALSLGLAVRRKGTCDPIVIEEEAPGQVSPSRTQPVAVSAVKAAADAGGNASRAYNKFLRTEDGDELKRLRSVLSIWSTPTAEAVSDVIKMFTKDAGKDRRPLRLSRLPSERIAAATVARCLYEIDGGRLEFLVPLIDMVGTGVVSSDAVLAVLGVSDSWEMGPESRTVTLSSITAPLTASMDCSHALEAVIAKVSDLPESDVVHAAQVAIRMRRANIDGPVDERDDDKKETAEHLKKRAELVKRADRLLLKCVTTCTDRTQLVMALRRMPPHDVTQMLDHFEQVLGAYDSAVLCALDEKAEHKQRSARVSSTDSATLKRSVAECIAYRGDRAWLDNRGKEGSELAACIEWTSHILDAHMTTLVLDKEGRKLAKLLLVAVQKQRRLSESIAPMVGIGLHLQESQPLPKHRDPLYSRTSCRVPSHAALS